MKEVLRKKKMAVLGIMKKKKIMKMRMTKTAQKDMKTWKTSERMKVKQMSTGYQSL